jgi:hypothetical protein
MSSATQKAETFCNRIRENIPSVTIGIAVLLLIVNIFLPGIGTLIIACINGKVHVEQIAVGILQFITAGIIIGWIWSIWWGILFVQKSNSRGGN